MLSIPLIGVLAGASISTVLLYTADDLGLVKKMLYFYIWLLAGASIAIKVLLLTGNQKVLYF